MRGKQVFWSTGKSIFLAYLQAEENEHKSHDHREITYERLPFDPADC